jgi:uncharacterized protein YjlB
MGCKGGRRHSRRDPGTSQGVDVEQLRFPAGDAIPNNPSLPVLAYRDALSDPERSFRENGWGGTWRSTVFPFHHFHSTSHEALGVAAGRATLALGGPQGEEVAVRSGDLLVLPAGTGHKRVDSSDDFLVVGAYPPGQEDYDLLRGDPAELEQAVANIERVELPAMCPVAGENGPLVDAWNVRL